MKRKTHAHPRWRWRLGGYLLVGAAIVFFFLVKLQTLIVRDPPDLAELPESSFEIRRFSNTTQPKLAFLFLARQHLPLDVLWEHFFECRELIQMNTAFTFTRDLVFLLPNITQPAVRLLIVSCKPLYR